jgi:cell division septation protein DedD
MASGGKRTAGERVLESKHVIGLFLLMLLFSGVFFSLGYVMGRNQYEMGSPTAFASKLDQPLPRKQDAAPKKSVQPTPAPANNEDQDPTTATPDPVWPSHENGKAAKTQSAHLEPAPKQPDMPVASTPPGSKVKPVSTPIATSRPIVGTPSVPNGAYLLQVAALQKQDDALTVAGSLQRKHFPCFVLPPQKDKYYRVQVGPFKDRKAADAAKQGLENEGFKAFYVKH